MNDPRLVDGNAGVSNLDSGASGYDTDVPHSQYAAVVVDSLGRKVADSLAEG